MIHVDDWSVIDNKLHIVSKKGDLDAVKRMCKADTNPAAAVMNASMFGHVEMLEYLLSSVSNADPTVWDNASINDATRNGHTEIVKILAADERVRKSISTQLLSLLIQVASNKGYAEILEVLNDL
jgi:ankyrin repeat protein